MLVDAEKAKEKLASMIESRWATIHYMVNQKAQATQSAKLIRAADLSDCRVGSRMKKSKKIGYRCRSCGAIRVVRKFAICPLCMLGTGTRAAKEEK